MQREEDEYTHIVARMDECPGHTAGINVQWAYLEHAVVVACSLDDGPGSGQLSNDQIYGAKPFEPQYHGQHPPGGAQVCVV